MFASESKEIVVINVGDQQEIIMINHTMGMNSFNVHKQEIRYTL
jgi:hypothetical protein